MRHLMVLATFIRVHDIVTLARCLIHGKHLTESVMKHAWYEVLEQDEPSTAINYLEKATDNNTKYKPVSHRYLQPSHQKQPSPTDTNVTYS